MARSTFDRTAPTVAFTLATAMRTSFIWRPSFLDP
jgi:hypothetical protein